MRRSAVVIALSLLVANLAAQTPQTPASTGKAAKVDVTPARAEAEVGQTLKFAAAAFDADGKPLDTKPSAWFAAPFDSAAADETGTVTFYQPGEVRVGALVDGKPGFAIVSVKPVSPARLAIAELHAPIATGGGIRLSASVLARDGTPLEGAAVTWSSDSPDIATIDASGFVTGVAPGKALIRAQSASASGTSTIVVVRNGVGAISVEPRTTAVRTGDVVRFTAKAAGDAAATPAIRWSVTGAGASIDPDGGFVAERPGAYVITASIGDRSSIASVTVRPRAVDRALEVVGRTPNEEFQTMEQWIIGKYAYVTSAMAGRLWVYDISKPAAPVKVDSVTFDARILNDISTTPDGKVAVGTPVTITGYDPDALVLDVAVVDSEPIPAE